MMVFLPAISKYRLKPVLLKNMPYGTCSPWRIDYQQINFPRSPCRRFAVSPTVSGTALETFGGSSSAQEIHGADQTVSVPGNAKRLLGLKMCGKTSAKQI
jgi:hypothetical protein